MDPKNLSSNWKQLQAKLKTTNGTVSSGAAAHQDSAKRKRHVSSSELPPSKKIKSRRSPQKLNVRFGNMEAKGAGVVENPRDFVVQKDVGGDTADRKTTGDRINEGLCTKSVNAALYGCLESGSSC